MPRRSSQFGVVAPAESDENWTHHPEGYTPGSTGLDRAIDQFEEARKGHGRGGTDLTLYRGRQGRAEVHGANVSGQAAPVVRGAVMTICHGRKVGQRGKAYERLKRRGLLDDLLEGRVMLAETGEMVGANQGAVCKALAAYRDKVERKRQRA